MDFDIVVFIPGQAVLASAGLEYSEGATPVHRFRSSQRQRWVGSLGATKRIPRLSLSCTTPVPCAHAHTGSVSKMKPHAKPNRNNKHSYDNIE